MTKPATGFSAFLAAATLAGCVPGDEPMHPMALRRADDGKVEVLYVPCEPGELMGFGILGSEPEENGGARRVNVHLWNITFDESPPDRFILGELPPGASEELAWRGDPLQEDWTYGVSFSWDGGLPRSAPGTRFELSDLEPGMVRYRDKYMTEEEFEESNLCGSHPNEEPVYPDL